MKFYYSMLQLKLNIALLYKGATQQMLNRITNVGNIIKHNLPLANLFIHPPKGGCYSAQLITYPSFSIRIASSVNCNG